MNQKLAPRELLDAAERIARAVERERSTLPVDLLLLAARLVQPLAAPVNRPA